jgi:hypothetical protein
MRDRHYVPNKGSHGQQLHFLVYFRDQHVGIISGGSSVWWVTSRDKFFGIPADHEKRGSLYLPSIVNNTVFRLEVKEYNLGTRVLAAWRRAMQKLWPYLYGVPVIGFETFIIEIPFRRGTLYESDNWVKVGVTQGSSKTHSLSMGNAGLTGGALWTKTEPKLVYCRWAKKPIVPTTVYVSSWRKQNDAEKKLDAERASLRKELLGVRFY